MATLVVLMFFALFLGAQASAQTPKQVSCKTGITWQITPEAEIRFFDCLLRQHKGRPALVMKASVKNVTDTPQRYRIQIFLVDRYKGAGCVVPQQGAPAAIAPGESMTVRIPFIHTRRMPKKVLVIVKTASMGEAQVSEPDMKFLGIGTAGSGGVYYPYALGVAQTWTQNVSGIRFAAEITAGTQENIRFCEQGETPFGAITNDVGYMAYSGWHNIKIQSRNIRTMFAMYPNVLHVIARRKAGVQSIEDLRGQRVSVGAPGSGTARMARLVLENTLGIKYSEFKTYRLTFHETAKALKTGRIDVGLFNVAPPAGLISRLLSSYDLELIRFSDAQLFEIENKYPFYARFTLPAAFYSDQNYDVTAPSVWNYFICHADLDPDLVYRLTRAFFENQDFLLPVHPFVKHSTPENSVQYAILPFHPGTINYLKEKEIDVPEVLFPH